MNKPRPEYIIYKGQIKLGQSITWHGALAVLVAAECLAQYRVAHTGSQYIQVVDMAGNSYRIVKER